MAVICFGGRGCVTVNDVRDKAQPLCDGTLNRALQLFELAKHDRLLVPSLDSSQLGDYAWYHYNSANRTHAVATKMPNPWGLYDMHGNVLQWCEDMYGDNSSDRVFRGS